MKQRGTALYAFGTKDEAYGFIENLTISVESSKTEVQNGIGDTVCVIWTDIKYRVQCDLTLLATAGGDAMPDFDSEDIVGSDLTISTRGTDDFTFIIDSSELKYAKATGATCTVQGYKYPHVED